MIAPMPASKVNQPNAIALVRLRRCRGQSPTVTFAFQRTKK